jgi:aspartyl/asparaginyl beta-hydroxylase (cupin superfamily)
MLNYYSILFILFFLSFVVFLVIVSIYYYALEYPHQLGKIHTKLINLLGKPADLQTTFYTIPTKLQHLNYKDYRENALLLLQNKQHFNHLRQYYYSNDKFYQGWTYLPLKLYGRDYRQHYDKELIKPFLSLLDDKEIFSVSISALVAGKYIEPHSSPFSGFLRYQLPLVVKGNCIIYVANDKKKYVEGKAFIFDDHLIHSVQNYSNHTRVALLLDIPREYNNKIQTLINNFSIKLLGYVTPIKF